MSRWWISPVVATVSLISLVALAIAVNIGSVWIAPQSGYSIGWIVKDSGVDAVDGWVAATGYMIRLPGGERTEVLASVGGLLESLSIYSLAELPNGSLAILAMHSSSKHWILFLWGASYGVDLGAAPLTYHNRSAPIPMSWCGSGICVVEVVNGSYGYAVDLINVSSSGIARAHLFTCRLGVAVSVPSYYNGTLFLGVYCNNGSRSIYGFAKVSGSRFALYNVTSMPTLPHFLARTRLFFEAGNISFIPCSIHPLYGDVYISGGSRAGSIIVHVALSINESRTWLITKLGDYNINAIPSYSTIYGGMLVVPLALTSPNGLAFGEIDLNLATDLITGYATPLSSIRGLPNLTQEDIKVLGTNGTIALYNLYFYNVTPQTSILETYVAMIKAPRTFAHTTFVYNTKKIGKIVKTMDREVSYKFQTQTLVKLSYVALPTETVNELILPLSSSTTSTRSTTSSTTTSTNMGAGATVATLAIALVALLALTRKGKVSRY